MYKTKGEDPGGTASYYAKGGLVWLCAECLVRFEAKAAASGSVRLGQSRGRTGGNTSQV